MRCETAALTQAEIGAIARRIDRPVVLVGLMGVGKSTVGRKLADILNVDSSTRTMRSKKRRR